MAHGEWWEYMIPGHRAWLLAQDILDPGSGKSDRVTAAQNNLNRIKSTDPGGYKSEYQDEIGSVQGQLKDLNDKGFSYDYTKDAAYQQYKNRYTRGAELASEDATARAAARSGGYGNSWGTSSGQNAYQTTMQGLSDAADSLYNQAYNEYAAKKSDLSNRLSALNQQEQLAQNTYNTRMSNYYNQLNNAESEYANAVNERQQGQANANSFFGNIMNLGVRLLPYLLGAL